MSIENQQIIDHVPTPDEFAASNATSRLETDATNFSDPEQRAAHSAALESIGQAPLSSEVPSYTPTIVLPQKELPRVSEYVKGKNEGRISGEEMRRLAALASTLGKSAIEGSQSSG